MNREEARNRVNEMEPTFLQPAKVISGKQTYVCPRCEKGKAGKGEGITPHISPNTGKRKYHCFFCDLDEDTTGLWKIYTNVSEMRKEDFDSLYAYYGLQVEELGEYRKQPKNEHTNNSIHIDTYTQEHTQTGGTDMAEEPKVDYTDFYIKANKDLNKTDYHRGISLDTLNRFLVGYVEQWTHPKDGRHYTSRLIVPNSKESYLARDTRENIPEDEERYKKMKVGRVHIFNSEDLKTDPKPFYVVEGEFDAMSIIDVGGQAVGLGSITMVDKFLKLLESQKIQDKTFIVALDNDKNPDTHKKVEEAMDKLEAGLDKLNLSHCRYNPANGYKDANAALIADREGLRMAVAEGEAMAEELSTAEREEYLQTSAAAHIQEFVDGIADSVNTPYIPTGFTQLDDILDGGLFEGLYIVGAISSLGKTTLVTQIADQIAEARKDVLIFSLEMARSELMAKSISRLTLLDVIQNNGDMRNVKTARGITTGVRYLNYSKEEHELIQRAVTAYSEYADKIYISEGVGNIGVDQIRDTVEKHIRFTGKKPVVVIDYIQILSPFDIRATDKQNTDKAVLELKRISRDYKIPVIGISSFNRESYKEEVKMEAFKESGAIEYGSDVLIGLQLKGAGDKNFDSNEAKQKNPREVELVILKNRNGATGDKVEMEYYPRFNYFREV